MRATASLSQDVYQEAQRQAQREGMSLAATLGALVEEALAARARLVGLSTSPRTGLPVFLLPGTVTAEQAARLIDENI
ncbi:MAG: hypothetical protein LBK59_12475 [Bifidobacteriaceae bacterium]|jgi:hypothetical protein|nr:hypothetical protein [Bifidobacteriaceae bacterium]